MLRDMENLLNKVYDNEVKDYWGKPKLVSP